MQAPEPSNAIECSMAATNVVAEDPAVPDTPTEEIQIIVQQPMEARHEHNAPETDDITTQELEEAHIITMAVPESSSEEINHEEINQNEVDEGGECVIVNTVPNDDNDGEGATQLATVQLGNLTCNSVNELAEHLPNIGIHFTCKKCGVVCTQMSQLLQHLSQGECKGEQSTTQAEDSAPSQRRKRGRAKKTETEKQIGPLPVKKETDYEELPRIAVEPDATPTTNRRTRYSMGKISRLDVLTLLGGRTKEEPAIDGDDDNDDEFKPDSSKMGSAEQEHVEQEDDEISGDEEWAPKRRKKNAKANEFYKKWEQLSSNEAVEVTEEDGELTVRPVSEHPKVTFRREGSANLIVLESGGKPEDDPDMVEFVEQLGGDDGGNESSAEGNEKENASDGTYTEMDQGESSHENDGNASDAIKKNKPRAYSSSVGVKPVKKRCYKCTSCKQRFFYTREELLIHIQCHTNRRNEEESYSCALETCDYRTKAWNRMLDHLCRHEEFKERLKNHTFVKNILGSFACPVCKKEFEKKNYMKSHLAKVHFKQDRTCGICNKVFEGADEKTFKRHVEKCQNLLFQCSHCSYKSPVSSNMRRHMKVHLGQGFNCEVCEAVFPSKQRLLVHRQIHETERQQYGCDQCATTFLSVDALKKHIIRFHTESTTIFACADCNFKTKIESDLKKHFSHVHDKTFKCEHCQYQSNSAQAFEQHQEYHTPGRSFACKYEGCYYRGATAKQLTNHINQVHKDTRRYQCPICHKFYKKKTHLARHLVCHTEDKPYSCLECGLAFNTHSTYYRHRNKTGHDAKREGITSVPQNITIHYVNQDGGTVGQEGLDGIRVTELPDGEQQTYQLLTQTESGDYIASDQPIVSEQAADDDGAQENVIMLESADGEQMTYVLRMSENENGETTIMTEDGVPMDANLVQQIQEQLQVYHQEVKEGEEGNAEVSQEQVALGEGMEVIDGNMVLHTQVVDQSNQVLVTEGDSVTSMDNMGQPIVVGQDDNGTQQQIYVEISPEGCQQMNQTVDSVAVGSEELETVQDVSEMTHQYIIEEQHVSEDQDHLHQAEEQIVYEESVVEVGNPRGEDADGKKQYAIVLLPSSAASGDEPEAALSMLQLQSGNALTVDENGVQYIIQSDDQ